MTNPLALVKSLDSTNRIPQAKREKSKSRRDRRKEQREKLRTAKLNERKIG